MARHNPGNKEVWKGLVEAKRQGLTRAIGVSHFKRPQLQSIMAMGLGVPAVNQCEMAVGDHDDGELR